MILKKINCLIVSMALAIMGAVGVVAATPAGATVTTVNASADAFIASDLPTTVENTTFVSMDNSPTRYGYFKFHVTVPAGESVTSAIFQCWPGSSNANGANLRTTSSSWSETTITWNNAPQANFSLPPSGSTGAVTSGQYNTANVTGAVTSGTGDYTFVASTASNTQWSCQSKENTHPPQLVVTTAAAANQPPTAAFTSSCTNLACSFNGSGSSDPDGTISSYSWNFGDGSAAGSGATPSHTYASAGTYTVALTVTDNNGATNSVSHPVTVTAPVTHTNTALPARGTFLYPWFPEAWNQGGVNPATHYNPSLGFYTSTSVFSQQVDSMIYGNFKYAVSSWWGQGSKEDTRLQPLLTAAHGKALKIAPYYEGEGNTITGVSGSPNPTTAQITSDLNYIAANYVNDPNYMWINDKPVLFVYGDGTDTCGTADRWATANAAASTHFYVVLKVFAGYTGCVNQPNNWHQYGPATAEDQQGSRSFSISPGFWRFDEASPRLTRDLTRWHTNVTDMNCSNADLQLVTTYNEWGEGSSVESATQWSSASGNGSYLDELHNNSTCSQPPPVDNPPTAAFTSSTSGLTASVNGSGSTDDHGISSYDWNWGDGTVHGSGVTASHTYSAAGTYTVTLTVTDTASQTATVAHSVTVSSGGTVQHKVMTIIGENHSLTQVLSGMPKLKARADQYGQANNYHGITHPSLPNYLAIAGGSTFGVTDDAAPSSHPLAGDSVFDQTIALGKTAKTYAEGMTSNCMLTNTGRYAVKHNPHPYFNGSTQRANCNANNVPMGTTTSGNLLNSINAGTLPATGMMVPDLCNDAHDCSLATFDNWLDPWVNKLMASPDYTSGNLTIIVTFDEDDSSSGNLIAFVVIDPRLNNVHKVVSLNTNHYALTRWYDNNVGAALLRNAASAPDLRAAFGL